MVSIKDFAIPEGWQNISWTPEAPGKESFVDEGTLLIGIADEGKSKCHVAWLDIEGRRWSIYGLPFVGDHLLAEKIDVICEATQQPPYPRRVDIRLDRVADKTVLTGRLRPVDGLGPVDGPVGTFTAEAHPHPVGEERIAV
jgi:hypothetical protein